MVITQQEQTIHPARKTGRGGYRPNSGRKSGCRAGGRVEVPAGEKQKALAHVMAYKFEEAVIRQRYEDAKKDNQSLSFNAWIIKTLMGQ